MPGFDGTGPLGYGPMTGRGLGPCGRGLRRGYFGFGRGRGIGFGRRFGGFGRWFGGFADPRFVYDFNLKDYKRYLEQELAIVNEELAKEEKE
ncbi:DUF5320 domain-containing protein [Thermosyntropha sp.]|uniref:DUF5320 domain-containing protein n=1 Tax=Thermosyntropha sp. TaxID=2740820 RepID=UPI0025EC3892|nr:DUF5320 domain-containing protein [Thermosyntropha sp.]MBO8158241.1 DUF5320 domain-containing protein [Thermosyntropha sp.]